LVFVASVQFHKKRYCLLLFAPTVTGAFAGWAFAQIDLDLHTAGVWENCCANGSRRIAYGHCMITCAACKVAQFLESHPKVERIFYPGLESHPHHELAARQMSNFGGMLTFRLKGGLGAAITLAEKIRLFSYATSLGHAHSLLFYYPTDMYIDAMPFYTAEQKRRIREWTGEGIVRASLGLESADDLIRDLDRALRARTFKGLIGPLAYQIMKKI